MVGGQYYIIIGIKAIANLVVSKKFGVITMLLTENYQRLNIFFVKIQSKSGCVLDVLEWGRRRG